MSSPSLINMLSSLFLVSLFVSIAQAQVPSSATFKFVNEGEYDFYLAEYNANHRPLDVSNSPFQLCFYNTTPNEYYLALRMAIHRSDTYYRWVWEANRGFPAEEKAALTFGTDGNLVLAEANGIVRWQTQTANKGVVGFKLLSNGNMVLHDSKGNFVWQSFDHPTNSLLVGQSLKVGGVTKLVSRFSQELNIDGAPYSLVLEPKVLSLNYWGKNYPRPLPYFVSPIWSTERGSIESVTYKSVPETKEAYAYKQILEYKLADNSSGAFLTLGRPKYNGTLSFLRLEIDGNLKIYTYNDKVDYDSWEVTFSFFDRESKWYAECQLPERCGNFGLCEDNQCVACPSSKGLFGWSKSCEAEKVRSCKASDFHYYKLEGVDHFSSRYTNGDAVKKIGDCENKCSKDCKCLGYFYNRQKSRCWIAYELKTLAKVDDNSSEYVDSSDYVAYIKAPNH